MIDRMAFQSGPPRAIRVIRVEDLADADATAARARRRGGGRAVRGPRTAPADRAPATRPAATPVGLRLVANTPEP